MLFLIPLYVTKFRIFTHLDHDSVAFTTQLLWNVWFERNHVVHGQNQDDAYMIIVNVIIQLYEFP